MNVEANDAITSVQLRGSVRWEHEDDSPAPLTSHPVYSAPTGHSIVAFYNPLLRIT